VCKTWSLTLREGHRLSVFENRVLRRIFGPKMEEVAKKWRKPHTEELSDWYCSPNIVTVIKCRKMNWAGHVARMGEGRDVYRVCWGILRERDHLEDPDLDEKIILKLVFVKWKGGMDWTEMARDTECLRELVNVAINFDVS